MSSWCFSTDASVASTTLGVELRLPERHERLAQSIVSATPGTLARSSSRSGSTNAAACGRQPLGHAGHAGAHDRDLALERRVADPVVEAAALERVVQLAGAVRGEDDHAAGCSARDRADLGDRHLEVGQELEQERLELVVGAVDLVDQQHRRHGVGVLDRVEQRPPLEEVAPEDVVRASARRRAPPPASSVRM